MQPPTLSLIGTTPRMRWAWTAAGVLLIAGWVHRPASAQEPAIFRGADLKLGEELIAQHRCAQCHAEKVGGDGSAIYRPLGVINNAGLLRGMVEQCNATLNFQMFPEEVTAVAAVLNRDHYRFKD
ncbi:hypothetical protein [Tepidicella xavieri]|uniref:Cytochrome c domain-containing protein n=1 Tax=Tepidicella xavieri TaxID=360241 RepID=A0A4R6UDB1_9BURK|nr:hypothetical protein [Tepidicella xavieri]TDQ44668.1 hypothetical protein DFR43_1026 [Tepidicella xavieri]